MIPGIGQRRRKALKAEPSVKTRILVVDDEASHRDSLRRIFERAGHVVSVAENGEEAIKLLREQPVDLVLTDLVMPRMDGIALLKGARTIQPDVDVVVMTAYGTVEHAVSAMREGAFHFITKPIKRGEVLACVDRAIEHRALVVENRQLKKALAAARGPEGIVGNSPAMSELLATLRQVAPSNATVLLLGESGTGKELCARAIHQLSPRADQSFIAVNCAALPESILEAELFGAEKGAYTGAEERRLGRFERAHQGTLFLDEIGDLPPAAQVKLLRFLQEGEIERLGGDATIALDVRVIAATHVDLKAEIARGNFREDLYYRLDVISLAIPPLRRRPGDIPLLATHFVKRFSEKHGKDVEGFETEALDALLGFSFPGNVRELENAIERAVVLCPARSIRLGDLPIAIQEAESAEPVVRHPEDDAISFQVGTTMAQLERAAIDATLRQVDGDKNLAAKLLGISLRTLYRRLEERDDAPSDQKT
jgi:two-component system response regulator HydG